MIPPAYYYFVLYTDFYNQAKKEESKLALRSF